GGDAPGAVPEKRHVAPRQDEDDSPDDVSGADEEVIAAPQEGEDEWEKMEGFPQIVGGEVGIPEPVSGGVMQKQQPCGQARQRQQEPQGLQAASPVPSFEEE